jgi:hypothetical protein
MVKSNHEGQEREANMNAAKLSRFGCTPQVLPLIILLAIISALAGWFSTGLFVLSAVFLCLTAYLTGRSVSKTIRELNEDADNLRQTTCGRT